MKGLTSQFRAELVDRVARHLGSGYSARKKDWSIGRQRNGRREHICIGVDGKWSPMVRIELFAGIVFPEVSEIQRRAGFVQQTHHIHVSSSNASHLRGFLYEGEAEWTVNASSAIPDVLVDEVAVSAIQLGKGLFSRFRDIRDVRNAIAANDPWITASNWEDVLALDLALDEFDHFYQWVQNDKYLAENPSDVQTAIHRVVETFRELESVRWYA